MMLLRSYLVLGALTVGTYGIGSWNGWEMGGGKREWVPQSVRSSPGGYRSHHFWHSGYRGGK